MTVPCCSKIVREEEREIKICRDMVVIEIRKLESVGRDCTDDTSMVIQRKLKRYIHNFLLKS